MSRAVPLGAALIAAAGALSGCYAQVEPENVAVIEEVYPPTVIGGYERVSGFLLDDQAREIAETFDWMDTTPLPETEPDGSPAMFYAVMRIDSLEEFDLLDEAHLAWDIQPLFDSERPDLPDEALNMSGGGAHGGWVFAILGGRVYNYLRDVAPRGEPLFDVVALRDVPAEVATNADGSIDLPALFASGFRFPTPPSSRVSSGAAVAHAEALTEVLSDIARGFVETAVAVIDAVLDFFGFLIGSTSPTATVAFTAIIASPDADFVPAGSAMLRAWGPLRGLPIANVGQEVFAQQTVFPFARFPGVLGPANATTFSLPNGATYRFCTRNRLGPAAMVDFWIPTQTCSGLIAIPVGAATATVAVTLADQESRP